MYLLKHFYCKINVFAYKCEKLINGVILSHFRPALDIPEVRTHRFLTYNFNQVLLISPLFFFKLKSNFAVLN